MRAKAIHSFLLALATAGGLGNATAQFQPRDVEDPDTPQWVEDNLVLPAFPQETDLREFYVSEITSHRFFVDAATLDVGQDGVVRFALVVRTSGGAVNITYEGIRCPTREYRIYATGYKEGIWAKTRRSEWRSIENKPVNRHHAALSRDLFCPRGVSIRTSEEGREALRLGKHPDIGN